MRLRWRYVLIPIGLVAALVLLVTAAGLAYLTTTYAARARRTAVEARALLAERDM
jgi:hypothetical protein